jgi:hypothetical protein
MKKNIFKLIFVFVSFLSLFLPVNFLNTSSYLKTYNLTKSADVGFEFKSKYKGNSLSGSLELYALFDSTVALKGKYDIIELDIKTGLKSCFEKTINVDGVKLE